VTLAAITVSVHVSSVTKSASGLTIQAVVPPETVTEWAPETEHESVNDALVAVTDSEKVTVMSLVRVTSPAPSAGAIVTTVGPRSATARGSGALTVKSAALLFVSVAPPPLR